MSKNPKEAVYEGEKVNAPANTRTNAALIQMMTGYKENPNPDTPAPVYNIQEINVSIETLIHFEQFVNGGPRSAEYDDDLYTFITDLRMLLENGKTVQIHPYFEERGIFYYSDPVLNEIDTQEIPGAE